MTIRRDADWYSVVRSNWQRTAGFLLASREPCLRIREQELRAVTGRALTGRDPSDLYRWHPPASWILGVIVCPGDSVMPVADWAARRKADPERIWFYLHRDVKTAVLAPWEEAGCGPAQVDFVSDWRQLHKLFGLALNDRVYKDWADAAAEA